MTTATVTKKLDPTTAELPATLTPALKGCVKAIAGDITAASQAKAGLARAQGTIKGHLLDVLREHGGKAQEAAAFVAAVCAAAATQWRVDSVARNIGAGLDDKARAAAIAEAFKSECYDGIEAVKQTLHSVPEYAGLTFGWQNKPKHSEVASGKAKYLAVVKASERKAVGKVARGQAETATDPTVKGADWADIGEAINAVIVAFGVDALVRASMARAGMDRLAVDALAVALTEARDNGKTLSAHALARVLTPAKGNK